MVRTARSAGATYGGETEGVNLNTQGGHVLLLEFTSQVALDEGGLAGTTIADQDQLKGRGLLSSHIVWLMC
jgi:hypothetical protein